MKKLFLLLIPITLLTLCGCSDNSISQRVYDLENNQKLLFDNDDSIVWRLDNIESAMFETGIIENDSINIQPNNLIYCHQRKDIKLWDSLYFPYLWNWNEEQLKQLPNIKTVDVGLITVYYEIWTAIELHWEIINWEQCITSINWYWTEPQKTYLDMIEHIKNYFECVNKWCSE